MKLKWNALAIATVAASAAWPQVSDAKVFFSDNFNSYALSLNWAPPSAIWVYPKVKGFGTVDLIGEHGSSTLYDLYPHNGGYVDLDGTDGQPGMIETTMNFKPGMYTLSFDLGGNARGDISKTTDISLGTFSTAITLTSGNSLKLYSYSFSTTGGHLVFSDLKGGNNDIGNILDNVKVSSAVPEPSTWAMMLLGFAGVGFFAYRTRKTAARAAA